jgi:hypothetical protein
MKKNAQKYQQWHTVQRLRAVGCPLDYAGLQQPMYPVLLSKLRSQWGTEIIPTLQGTGILVPIRIQTFASFTISGWAVSQDWASRLSTPSECSQHPGFCCLEQSPNGNHIQLGESSILNRRILGRAQFFAGAAIEGFLLLKTPTLLAPTARPKLKITTVIVDLFSERYPFLMELDNNPQALHPRAENGKTGQESSSQPEQPSRDGTVLATQSK